jgi:hypothetical protein
MGSQDRDCALTEQAGSLLTQTVSDTPHTPQTASQQEYKGASSHNSHHGKPEEQPGNTSSDVAESAKFAFQDADMPLEVRLFCLHISYYYSSG